MTVREDIFYSLAHLSVADGTDDLAVLLYLVEVLVDGQRAASVVLPVVSTLGERLLLGTIPISKQKDGQTWEMGEREKSLLGTHQQHICMSGVPQLSREVEESRTHIQENLFPSVMNSPVLVESSLAFVAQVLCKDGLERPQASGGLHIANYPHQHHGWGLNNGNSLDYFMLMRL